MKLHPIYAEDIVVGVIRHNTFSWYVTEKGYWYLDLIKFDQALIASGYGSKDTGHYTDRFDIAIVNEHTVDLFLAFLTDRQVTSLELQEQMRDDSECIRHILYEKISPTEDDADDLLDFIPCLLVDFDQKQLYSMYPEMIRFELYVPDNWVGKREDFTHLIPKSERYWLIDDLNLFMTCKKDDTHHAKSHGKTGSRPQNHVIPRR